MHRDLREPARIRRKRTALSVLLSVALIGALAFPKSVKANDPFDIEGGVLRQYTGNDAEVEIPDTVSQIGEAAFRGNKTVEAVTVHGENLREVGKLAFEGCSNLKYFDFSDGLQSVGESAFESSGLLFASMPDSLRRIDSKAFWNSKIRAIHLNNGLETVGNRAFETCYALRGLKIPASVTSIGQSFAGDNGSKFKWLLVENDTLPIPDTPTDPMSICYYGGAQSTLQKIYEAVKTKNPATKLTFASKDTFVPYTQFAFSLTERHEEPGKEFDLSLETQPADVSYPGAAFVSSRPDIADVDDNGHISTKKIGSATIYAFSADGSFASCQIHVQAAVLFEVDGENRLTKYYGHEHDVTIPDSVSGKVVKAIAASAFQGNPSLESIKIGSQVEKLETAAFKGCDALKSLTFTDTRHEPSALRELGDEVFADCKVLDEIVLPSSVEKLGTGVFKNAKALHHVILPDKLTLIPDESFSGCTALTEFRMPKACEHIGALAFHQCSSLEDPHFRTDTKTLTAIGKSAFEGSGMRSLTIPEGVQTIGVNAFASMNKLEKIHFPSTFTEIPEEIGQQGIRLNTTADLFEFFDNESTTQLMSIEVASGNPVFNSIDGILYKGKTLAYVPQARTTLRVAEGTTRIGKRAAKTHMQLERVEMPDSVEVIEESAFQNCFKLRSVKMPARLKRIGSAAFLGAEELESMDIPETVEEIESLGLYELESIKSLHVPEGVQVIHPFAVAGNDSLETLILPRNLMKIENSGASFSKSLTDLYLPEIKLESIGEESFGVCSSVEHLEVPACVRSIGKRAFSYGVNLKSIYLPGTVQLGEDVFASTQPGQSIYVFTNDENDSIKALFKDSDSPFKRVQLNYSKETRSKVEVQGLEGLLTNKAVQPALTLTVKDQTTQEGEALRVRVTATEGGERLAKPYQPLRLILELPAEFEKEDGWTVYQKNDNGYQALPTNRLNRFLRVNMDRFSDFVVAKKAPQEPGPQSDSFTLSFDANGGSWKDGRTTQTLQAAAGEEIRILEAPSKPGYTFLYWKGSKYQPGDVYTVKENHTFVAEWEKSDIAQGGNGESKTPSPAPSDKNLPKTGENSSFGAGRLLGVLALLAALAGLALLKRRLWRATELAGRKRDK